MVISSNGSSPLSTRLAWSGSNSPTHLPISTVATALPEKLVTARASDMNRSMPTISPTPSTRSGRWAPRPPARVARPAPVTPAAPFDAMIMNSSSEICSPIDSGVPIASAMNSEAIVR